MTPRFRFYFSVALGSLTAIPAFAQETTAISPFLTVGQEKLSLNGVWKFKATTRDITPSATDIIVDNADKSQVEIVGPNWTESQWKGGGAFWEENYLVATKRSKAEAAWVLFKPTIPAAQNYEVFSRWSRGDRSQNVKITINFQGGSKTVVVNQTTNSGNWVSLGSFAFAPNSNNNIKVDASGGGAPVVADAIMLSPLGNEKVPDVQESLFSPTVNDKNWEQMQVPSNWDTTNKYAHYVGEAWYRRSFTPPIAWKGSRNRLLLDAVYHDATVYLNGQLLSGHRGGYTPFELDVTDALRYGQPNLLVVKADNSFQRGAWWAWGGISRPVNLVRNNEVRIVRQNIRTEPDLASGRAKVFVRLTLENNAQAARTVQLNTQLALRGSSKIIWTSKQSPALNTSATIPANAQKVIEWETTLPANHVRLWDFDHPNLYECLTTATIAGRLQHRLANRFGIRKIEVTQNQLLLNGEPVRLGGFNRVHDHRVWGNTEPEHLVRQDVDMMKRLGGNLMRIMHGAQAPNLLDYLDEKGVLVFEEIPVWGYDDPSQREAGNATTKRWLREMIERDANHPSIIGWSMGNEIIGHFDYVKTMIDYVRSDLDSHRLLGYVSNSGVWPNSNPQNDPITISALTMHNNYGSLQGQIKTLRQRWPDKPVFFTEFGSSQIGVSLDAKLNRIEAEIDSVRQASPYVVGISMWTFNDYRSPYKDTPASEDRAWGIVNSWRQPKRAFEQIAQQFSPIKSLSLQKLSATGLQNQASINLEPRAAVDFPSYILRDYKLKWELRSKTGEIVGGGLFDLPTIKPGSTNLTFPLSWKTPKSPLVDVVLTLISPTGYVAHESREALAVPAKPQISAVISGDKSARILFTPVTGAEEYQVIYGANSELTSARTIDTQITINGLANGTNTKFSVVAINGRGSSQPSNIVNVTPNGPILPPIVWKAVPMDGGFAVGYSVEKSDDLFSIEYGTKPDNLNQSLSNLKVKGSATMTGLRNGTTYYFRIKRQGDYGESSWSQVVSVTPNGKLPPPIPVLHGGVRGKGQISLRFEPSEQATAYRIRYANAGNSTAKLFTVEAAAINQAIITGLDDTQAYTLSIAAVSAVGVSRFSFPITINKP